MMPDTLTALIEAQATVIMALDGRDPARIEAASAALADALDRLRVDQDASTSEEDLKHAMRQAEAARIRVNCLAQWNRQRMDALTALRLGNDPQLYARV